MTALVALFIMTQRRTFCVDDAVDVDAVEDQVVGGRGDGVLRGGRVAEADDGVDVAADGRAELDAGEAVVVRPRSVAIAPYMLLPMIFASFADAARDGVMRVPGSRSSHPEDRCG